MDTGNDNKYSGSDSLRALWRRVRRRRSLRASRRKRSYFDGRVSACRSLLEEYSRGSANGLPTDHLRGEPRRQHQESGPEAYTHGFEGGVRLDEYGVRQRVQAVALASLHQVIEGLLQGGPDRVLPRVRLRIDIGRTRRLADEQLDGMPPVPPFCEGSHTSTGPTHPDDENPKGFPALVVYECWDVWTPETGLHDPEGHEQLGDGHGDYRSEDGDSFAVKCEGMGGRVEDNEMLNAAQHLKQTLERQVENYAIEFDMNKWVVAGVLQEMAIDYLFKDDEFPKDEDDDE